MAILLNVEDKIIMPMFQAVQKTKSIQTIGDIRQIFIDIGINSEDYDNAWNSHIVQSLVLQQEQALVDFKLQAIPAVFINGKYQMNLQKMEINNIDIFIQQYLNLIKFLVEKNKY